MASLMYSSSHILGTPPTSASLNPTWGYRYDQLLSWRAEHGDTCVPKAEGALGRWVARQRELKRTGKLDPNREQALNSINFVWNTVTAMWEERFRRLSKWRKEYGHCAVPIAQGDLGTWVSKQRQLRKRGKLSKEKVDALNSLKFTWSTADADWEDKFKRLVEWARERGHASVPFNEGELGWWVNTQRQCKRKGKLSEVREARLQTLGFVWNPSNSRSRGSHTNSKALPMVSSVSCTETTGAVRCAPEKQEKEIFVQDCLKGIPFPIDSLFPSPDFRTELDLFHDKSSLVSVDLFLGDISSSGPSNESCFSPQYTSLTQTSWSSSMPSPPQLNETWSNSFNVGQSVPSSPTGMGLMESINFGALNVFSACTEDLEQLLGKDDSNLAEYDAIDSIYEDYNSRRV